MKETVKKEKMSKETWNAPEIRVKPISELTLGGLNNSSDGLDIGTLS